MKLICGSNKVTLADCCAASARAGYLRFLEEDALPMCLATPNSMTRNLFEYVELPLPQVTTTIKEEHTLTLLNHNQEKDSIAERNKYNLDAILDVHPISLTLETPIMIRTEKVGSIGTLIAEIFLEQIYVPTKQEATLLLVAIIDDTAMFTSEETTDRDNHAVDRLNEIAGVEDLKGLIAELQN